MGKNILVVLDRDFRYQWAEEELPVIGADNQPTGASEKVVKLVAGDADCVVELRFTPDAWEEFGRQVTGAKVVVAQRIPN